MGGSVIILGKGSLAIQVSAWFLAQTDWQLAGIVPVIPEPVWTSSLSEWAEAHHVPTVCSGRADDADAVLGCTSQRRPGAIADLAISVFYDRILRPSFLDRVVRTINIHNAPLPRYRGVAPINWALKDGQRSHGVTIHDVTPGIDDGPILAQSTFSLYPEFDEVIDVYRRALRYGWLTFLETIPLLDRITPITQGPGATYHRRDEEGTLGDRRSFTVAESRRMASAIFDGDEKRIGVDQMAHAGTERGEATSAGTGRS